MRSVWQTDVIVKRHSVVLFQSFVEYELCEAVRSRHLCRSFRLLEAARQSSLDVGGVGANCPGSLQVASGVGVSSLLTVDRSQSSVGFEQVRVGCQGPIDAFHRLLNVAHS